MLGSLAEVPKVNQFPKIPFIPRFHSLSGSPAAAGCSLDTGPAYPWSEFGDDVEEGEGVLL